MIRKIRKTSSTSDSLSITIPKYIVEEMELTAEQEVDIKIINKNKITIEILKDKIN